jgi:branched-subunit amino acid aminotransferase/4-amino-4-deoxychorismate lyase
VLTPPLSSGCLEGVTRGILFEIAGEAGAAVKEQTLKLEDFYTADEVFVSSTNRNVIGVGEIGRQIFSRAPGPVTLRLNEVFTSYVDDYVTRRLAAASR